MRAADRPVLVFSVLFGLALGVGVFTFGYAKGGSYLTDDPNACANCHVMDDHFDSWAKSSHKAVAVCNDCHTPSGFIPKYMNKASNGFWHSFAFTTGDFPDPIQIKGHNLEVTEDACLKCHADVAASMAAGPHITGAADPETADVPPPRVLADGISCTRCHNTVGHWVR